MAALLSARYVSEASHILQVKLKTPECDAEYKFFCSLCLNQQHGRMLRLNKNGGDYLLTYQEGLSQKLLCAYYFIVEQPSSSTNFCVSDGVNPQSAILR